jgi:hypothetical protein
MKFFKKMVAAVTLLMVLMGGMIGCADMQKMFLKDNTTNMTELDMAKVKANMDVAKSYLEKFRTMYGLVVAMFGAKLGGNVAAEAVMVGVDNALKMLGEAIDRNEVSDGTLALVRITLDMANQYVNKYMVVK